MSIVGTTKIHTTFHVYVEIYALAWQRHIALFVVVNHAGVPRAERIFLLCVPFVRFSSPPCSSTLWRHGSLTLAPIPESA